MVTFNRPDPWKANPKEALEDAVRREMAARLKRAERAAVRKARGEVTPEVKTNLDARCTECLTEGLVVKARAKGLCGKHYQRDWRGISSQRTLYYHRD